MYDFSIFADSLSGQFCRSGCSHSPKNNADVSTFPSAKAALEWGFLPCPDCRPMDVQLPPGLSQDEGASMRKLLDDIAEDLSFSIKQKELEKRGISVDALRRLYMSQLDLSFQDMLRMRRVNLRFGPSKNTGKTADGNTIVISRLTSPLGPLLAGATEGGICLLEFAERRMMETQIQRLETYYHGEVTLGRSSFFPILQKELDEYFEGGRPDFTVPIDLRGTDFQLRVWHGLLNIPYGQVCSYGQQAAAIGEPKAVRAVGRANGENRIAILVPCHRVIGADGTPTGYGGRIWRKEALLRLESPQGSLFE